MTLVLKGILKSNMDNAIGRSIKYKRMKSDISGRKLSEISGLSPSYVSKVENGTLIPSINCFAALVCNLDFSEKEIALLINILYNDRNQTS